VNLVDSISTNFHYIKNQIKIKELSLHHLIFNPFSSDFKLSLIQVFSMMIFTFQSINHTSKMHARNWTEFSQWQQDSRTKTNHSNQRSKANKINPLFGFATPRLKKNYSHILEIKLNIARLNLTREIERKESLEKAYSSTRSTIFRLASKPDVFSWPCFFFFSFPFNGVRVSLRVAKLCNPP